MIQKLWKKIIAALLLIAFISVSYFTYLNYRNEQIIISVLNNQGSTIQAVVNFLNQIIQANQPKTK